MTLFEKARVRKQEHCAFGTGFPGFGEDSRMESSAWDAVVSAADAPFNEPQRTGHADDGDFSECGKYSGVGMMADDDPLDFDPEPAHVGFCVGDGDKAGCESARPETALPRTKINLANFRELYCSRDGGLCLYEDENGHLVAVDSSKLV